MISEAFDDQPYWTQQRRQLVEWLRDRAPSFVDGYIGAVRLLHLPEFPARVNFVCHAVRDIYRLLPTSLGTKTLPRPQEIFPDMVRELVKRWDTSPPSNLERPDEMNSDFPLNSQVLAQLKTIVWKSRELGIQPSVGKQLAIALFRSLDRPQGDFIHPWVTKAFDAEYKFFVSRAHLAGSADKIPRDDGLVEHFEAFERAFHSLVGPYFTGKEELDAILQDPNLSEIDVAVQRMRSPEFAAYFLGRLENPRWIGALRDNGLFACPPPVVRNEGGFVTYPHWSASKYLVRMASRASSEVAEIFACIETDNLAVIGDMIASALKMPANVAASLVPRISHAAVHETLWIHFNKASDLCARLAEADETDAAIRLAESLFAPRFEAGREKPTGIDEYWYKGGLAQVVPALAIKMRSEFLKRLCAWLKTSVEAKAQVDGYSRYSYLWRPAIEENELNKDYDFAGAMVGFVREGLDVAMRGGHVSLAEALQTLDQYPDLIFRRLRLYLITQFADQNLELVRETILARELFDSREFEHEYAVLVGRRLDVLAPSEKADWFGWIHEGPDTSEFDRYLGGFSPDIPIDERRRLWVEDWQLEKLHWVRNHLDDTERTFYEELVSVHGRPESAEINVNVTMGFHGDRSPLTVEQLAGMTFDSAVEKVSSWRDEGPRIGGATLEGLAMTFGRFVATNPHGLSLHARSMIDRPPVFVRQFISQMSAAIQDGRDVDVPAVLELCDWVVRQPLEEGTIDERPFASRGESDWGWTREEISRLIRTCCVARNSEAPRYHLELREQIWSVVSKLCGDSPKSQIVHHFTEDDARVQDYLHLGINSFRGKGVDAALEYARWVAKHLEGWEAGRDQVVTGFDAMPEFRATLEWQLASENQNVEVMAVIGSHIDLIYWIDKEWLVKNAQRIFSSENAERAPVTAAGWAAWNAFLVWVRPHIELYRIFRAQFAYAVEQTANVKLTERSREQPMCRLGEHLMVLYGRGELGLEDDGQLLSRFLLQSAPEIRQHAIGFVGESLGGMQPIPLEMINRFKILWDLYWAGPGRNDASETRGEWLFGAWFACGKFPPEWAVDRLLAFVAINPTPEPDGMIVEELARVTCVDALKAVRILDAMIHGDREGWRIEAWQDSATRILDNALRTEQAREIATALVQFLGRRGYIEFGKLLKGVH